MARATMPGFAAFVNTRDRAPNNDDRAGYL